jgi:hypothetical protein
MALANLKHGSSRWLIHLFDAFQKICEPSEIDGRKAMMEVQSAGHKATGRLQPMVGIYDQWRGLRTLEECGRLLEETIGYDRQFIRYHKGWFRDTLPADAGAIREIAVLRIDGD